MRALSRLILLIAVLSLATSSAATQGGAHTLFGDLHVDETKVEGVKPLVYEIILYNLGGNIVARQFVNAGGRYRFLNIANGQYYLAVLLENEEIGRSRFEVLAPLKNDFRHDLSLEWRPNPHARRKAGTISAADFYHRTAANKRLFNRAKEAIDRQRYDDALAALQSLLAIDPRDFQAWSELGTVNLLNQNYEESEKAYSRAITERPTFFLALLNLGRLRTLRKDFAGAIEPLLAAVRIKPDSADANYHLGEAYLQIKKGSIAVNYLYKSLELDPVGKAYAHLRLATLYNAASLRQKAAAEYAAFLKKRPDYADRKKLEQYIALNKRQAGTKRR